MGKNHKLDKYEMSADGTELTLIWKGLNSDGVADLDIEFQGHVKLTSDGLIFDGIIKNQSNLTIDAVYWPYIGDFSVPNKKEESNWLKFEYGGGMQKSGISPDFSSFIFYSGVDYPIQFHRTQYANFGLYQAADKGIYVGYHDTTVENLCAFAFELMPGVEIPGGVWGGSIPLGDSIGNKPVHIEFSSIHFAYIHPNEDYKLQPIVMNPYVGAWHAGADFYKDWRKTWKKDLTIPEWATRVHSWQQLHIFSAEDRVVFTYPQLVEYCKECEENDVKAIQLTGWTLGGQDRSNPSHDIEPKLGTWKELNSAIKTCENMGVKIVLSNKYTWADLSTHWFDNELIKYSTKDPYGDFHWYRGYPYQTATQLNNINTRRLVPMCPYSKTWRDIVAKEAKKSFDLGASGMLFDENQHHGDFFYCFDKTHGHEVPAYIFGGDKYLEEIFHDLSNKYKPDYLLAGESNRDLQFQSYHMSYFRIDKNYIPMHRYVAPNELMMVAVVGYNDRLTINQCLLFNFIMSYEPRNFKGKLSEFPLTIEYGIKVDALRKKYQDYLWYGEFQDKIGAEVKVQDQIHPNYSVFKNKANGKKAVVIANFDTQNEMKVNVELTELNGKLVYVSPENLKESVYENGISVNPSSTIVIIEK